METPETKPAETQPPQPIELQTGEQAGFNSDEDGMYPPDYMKRYIDYYGGYHLEM